MVVGLLLTQVARGSELDQQVGPLVLDEVFLDPGNLASYLGGYQWLELANPSEQDQPLEDVALTVDGAAWVALDPQVVLTPGERFVLVLVPDAASLGGLPLDPSDLGFPVQLLADKPLPAQGAVLALVRGEELIDLLDARVEAGFAPPPGYSLALEPGAFDPLENDDPSHWCAGAVKTSLLGHLVNGSPGEANPACDSDGDGLSEDQGDCHDGDSAVYSGAPELCDGLDNDCNGLTDDAPALAESMGCLQLGVCLGAQAACGADATLACAYPPQYEATEVTCDGLDNDCDGATDEGLVNACGLCGALAAEVCDGLDNDCDGQVDEDLVPPANDKEGAPCASEGVCLGAKVTCAGLDGWVCSYGAGRQANETACDQLDNDCDGVTDEGFPVGQPCTLRNGACASQGTWRCSADGAGVECSAPQVVTGEERCGDGADNDCDGQTDEGFPVGQACTVGVGACKVTGTWACASDGRGVVCGATPGAAQREFCDDGLDNDCDGTVDEAECDALIPEPGGNPTDLGGARGCAFRPTRAPGGLATLLMLLASLLPLAARRVLRA
jgi:hypothetical protein